ncbi:tyrosine-type recombinase/integrase [Sphaerotilus hippei]|uniref:tyrosine-type recombinase/integrase n=1 Tax=Sphaerotilus hippei TaxID=744406 RepID=UPI0035C068CA
MALDDAWDLPSPAPESVWSEVDALSPEALGPMAEEALRALLSEGESPNTLRSYQTALRYWAAWYTMRYRRAIALPVAVPVLLQFVVDHAQRSTPQGPVSELPPAIDRALVDGGFKSRLGAPALTTLSHRISVLSKVHQIKGLPNPCQDPQLKDLLSRTRRAYARRGDLPQRKPALTREPLQALLDTCDDSLRGRRDRALLLFAWASGGRRRSEVTAATLANVRRQADGSYLYTLNHSKTNQAGRDRPDNRKPVVGVAAQALAAWLQASGVVEGAIFRRIRRGDLVAEPLSPAAVRDIVRQRCALAGLPEDFSAHSLRSGFVTEAGHQNIPLGETMALTGHASVATVVSYFRAGAQPGRASSLLDRPAGAPDPIDEPPPSGRRRG